MKKLGLAFVIFLLIAGIGLALNNVEIAPSADSQSAFPSDFISKTFSVNNTNTTNNLTFTLPTSVIFTGTTQNQTVSIQYNITNPLEIENSTNVSVGYNFTTPNIIASETFIGVFNITANNSDFGTFTLTLDVKPTLIGTPAIQSLSGFQGDNVAGIVEFENTETSRNISVTLPSTLILEGSRENKTVTVTYNESSPMDLGPSTNRTINYTFTIPTSTFNDTYTTDYNFTANNSHFHDLDIRLAVLANKSATISNVVLTAVKGRSTNGTVTVTDTGNTDFTGLGFSLTDLVDITNSSNSISNSTITIPSGFGVNFSGSTLQNLTFAVPATQRNATYSGNLTLIYDGTTATSNVTVTVEPSQFAITASPSPVAYGTVNVNTTTTQSLTITNSGNDDLTNLRIANNNIPTRFNLTFDDNSSQTLTSSNSRNVVLSISIPSSEDSGLQTLGTVDIFSDQTNSSVSLTVDVQGRLIIEDVEVDVGDDTDSNVNDGETISKKAEPGDEVKFTVDIRNGFSKASDIDLEDVIITITIEDIDDSDDLEEESDEFDIDAGDNEDEVITFQIPEDAEEDTYDVIIEVEADDSDGNNHETQIEVKLRVDRERHKLIIQRSTLENNINTCKRTNSLTILAKNIGSNEEDESVLTIVNQDLGINTRDFFELEEDPDDSDSEFSKTVNFKLPDNLANGDYPIDVRLYYDTDKLVDTENVILKVADCATATTTPSDSGSETPSDDGAVVVVTPPAAAGSTTPVSTTSQTQGSSTFVTDLGGSVRSSSLYTIMLVVANIIIVVLVVVLFVQLLKPPRMIPE
ncbi:MAG: hypothetical protein QGH47_01065 [Candidatus Woesearchaeota archaeon]|jgi:hypothetical protein|nr:hypothetical protein [Candidatus Woesearchaeota archaeon]